MKFVAAGNTGKHSIRVYLRNLAEAKIRRYNSSLLQQDPLVDTIEKVRNGEGGTEFGSQIIDDQQIDVLDQILDR